VVRQHVVVQYDLTTQKFRRLLLRKRHAFLSDAERMCLRIYEEALDSGARSKEEVLNSGQAESFLLGYLEKLESNIRMIAEKHDVPGMLLQARRLRPQALRGRYKGTSWNILRTLTLAILKYGNIRLPSSVRKTLSGGKAEMITEVTHRSVADTVKLLLLCDAHYSATCSLRYVRKGASLLLDKDHPLARPEEDLRRAVEFYDFRLENARCSLFDHAGLLHDIGFPRMSGEPFMFCCGPNEDEEEEGLRLQDESLEIELPPPNYYPGLISLKRFPEYGHLFSSSLRSTYNCEPEQLFNLIRLLCAWLLIDFREEAPAKLYQYSQRGLSVGTYSALRGNLPQLIKWSESMLIGGAKGISADLAMRLLEDFSICPEKQQDNIDLVRWEPKYALYLGDDFFIIDLLAIGEFIGGILWKTQLTDTERNIKGSKFEDELLTYVLNASPSVSQVFSPRKKLKLRGRLRAEIDLSLAKNSTCFLIDCKSYSISAALFEGQRQAVLNRWNTNIDWVRDNDGRASFLADNPIGDNYRLPMECLYVVPIVCTTYPEFLFDVSDRMLLSGDIPRVCTPKELTEFLDSFREPELTSRSYTRKVLAHS